MKHEPLDGNGCPPHSLAGTPRAEISAQVGPVEGDIVIEKQRFTAF